MCVKNGGGMDMSFSQARKLLDIILASVMVIALLGMIFQDSWLMTPIFILVVGLLFALIYVSATYLKCPHCDSGIDPRISRQATHCPFCGEKLE